MSSSSSCRFLASSRAFLFFSAFYACFSFFFVVLMHQLLFPLFLFAIEAVLFVFFHLFVAFPALAKDVLLPLFVVQFLQLQLFLVLAIVVFVFGGVFLPLVFSTK